MDTILLLGGNFSDILLIKCAKRIGYRLIAVNNNPDKIVNKYCDEHVNLDYSDLDGVLSLAIERKISYILAGSNDAAYLTCSYVAENLGLPGYDNYQTAKVIHNKDMFRSFMFKNDIESKLGFKITIDELLSNGSINPYGP